MSKDTASPAMRIGCVVGDSKVIKCISRHNSLFYSCLPKFIQLAAAEYLMEDHRPYRIKMRNEMIRRINTIDEILKIIETDLANIAGQKPVITKSKKAISNFKTRAKIPLGLKCSFMGSFNRWWHTN